MVRIVLSAVLKFSNFIISLFFTSLTSRIFIVLLFLTRAYTVLFNNNFLSSKNFMKNYVNRHSSQLIYDTNLFDSNCNLFYMFLTNFNNSVQFAIWIVVSISVFHTYLKIYLLLGLWNLEVLAKLRHNLRQYLNVCFFLIILLYIYLRNKCDMRLTYFLITFVCLYSLTGPSSARCTFKLKSVINIRFHFYLRWTN